MLGATVALILLLLPFFYQLFVAGVGQDTGAFVPASVVPLSLLENTWTLENPLKQVCTAVSLSSLGSSSSVSGEGVPAREAVFVLGLGCLVYTHVPPDSLQSFSELHRENADRNYEKNMLFKVSYLAKLHSQSSTGEIIGVDGSSARAGGCPNSTEFYLVLEGIFSHSVNISADSTDWKQYEYVFAISPAAANSSPIAVEESNTRKFIFLNGYLIANPGATMDGLSHCASHLNVAVNNISISYINQPGK